MIKYTQMIFTDLFFSKWNHVATVKNRYEYNIK